MQFLSINSLPSMGFSFPEFLPNVSILDIMDRVKNIAMRVFNTAAGYFKTYDNYSEEENLKAFALISCISLVALLLINILFKNGRSILPPSTPVTPDVNNCSGSD